MTDAVIGVPFPIASRAHARYSMTVPTATNLSAGGSFPVVQLAATGWVRRVELAFTFSMTCASAAAVVAGDAPFNLVTGVSLTDAQGTSVMVPISGYNLYLHNKYLGSGTVFQDFPSFRANPHQGPRYTFTASGTSAAASFVLWLNFEQDAATGYGSIPNLDSNSSLQLKVDYAVYTVAATGTTVSAATLGYTAKSYFWAPVPDTMAGNAVIPSPPGAGEYLQTRYETKTLTAAAENIIDHTARGGYVKGFILISRAAGVRTDATAGANFGVMLDNQAIWEGMPIEDLQDDVRRAFGYLGSDLTTSYAQATGLVGLDRGVVPFLPWTTSGASNRSGWLKTINGSLLQTKFTPGASATGLEILTAQIITKNPTAFYGY